MKIFRTPSKLSNELAPISLLLRILSWRRPHNSDAEGQFIHDLIDPLDPEIDTYGNRYIRIGHDPVVWSCHVDTVHHEGGYQRLNIHQDTDGSHNLSVVKGDGNCLGADDGTGVWLCMQMIAAKKPGLYIFHRGEECGCLGSRHIASKEKDLLKGITSAIAFDRRGKTSVITHQRGDRCCSDAFAKALTAQLGGTFAPDPTGVYTDTACYTGLIPECTNLSVGYDNQHGPRETQNLAFAIWLRKAVLALRPLDLPIERDHTARPIPTVNPHYQYNRNGYGQYAAIPEWEKTLFSLINMNPKDVEKLFNNYGIDKEDLLDVMDPTWRNKKALADEEKARREAALASDAEAFGAYGGAYNDPDRYMVE